MNNDFNSAGEFGKALGDLVLAAPIPALKAIHSMIFELDGRLPDSEDLERYRAIKQISDKQILDN